MPETVPESSESKLTEDELIQALRSGSASALAEAFSRYSRAVFAVARSLSRSHADAEDVMQNVFVGLPEAVRSFEGRGAFEGWLKRVTARHALMYLRMTDRESQFDHDAPRLDRTARSQTLNQICLERGLAELTPEQRTVFLMKELHGFTHREIGEVLGIREGTSKVRLHRAKRRLREAILSGPEAPRPERERGEGAEA